MNRLPFSFMVMAVIYVLVGMLYGIHMAANQDFATAPAHGHLNLIGFVMGAIFAFFYHLVPSAQGRAGWAHFWLHQLSVVILFPGIIMANLGESETLAKTGAVIAVVSIIVFGWVLFASRQKASPQK